MKKQIYYLIVISFFSLRGIQAQETVLSSGGDASGSGGSFSYSVGQIVYTTNSGSNGNLAQGVQQPFEISAVLAVDNLLGINLNLTAYPNPTTNFLNLTVTNMDYKNLSYQLYDLNGRILVDKKLKNISTEITMKYLPSSFYYLKILKNSKPIKVFKIIKTQ